MMYASKLRFQNYLIRFVHTVLFLGMILSEIPAAARSLDSNGYDPSLVVAAGFRQVLGQDLDGQDYRQIEKFLLQLDQAQKGDTDNGLIHKASWLPSVPNLQQLLDFSEVLPVICLYGKASLKVPGTANLSVNGLSIGKELTPCLVLNSVNPMKLKVSEFHSYIMKGASLAAAEGRVGSLSAGIVAGLYAGPKSLAHPLIGQYYFFRLQLQKSMAKVIAQVALSETGQKLVMAGVGGELSLDNMASLLLQLVNLPKLDIQGMKLGQKRGEIGTYYSVYEFPWFRRLINGVDPVTAFSDIDQYIAANP